MDALNHHHHHHTVSLVVSGEQIVRLVGKMCAVVAEAVGRFAQIDLL